MAGSSGRSMGRHGRRGAASPCLAPWPRCPWGRGRAPGAPARRQRLRSLRRTSARSWHACSSPGGPPHSPRRSHTTTSATYSPRRSGAGPGSASSVAMSGSRAPAARQRSTAWDTQCRRLERAWAAQASSWARRASGRWSSTSRRQSSSTPQASRSRGVSVPLSGWSLGSTQAVRQGVLHGPPVPQISSTSSTDSTLETSRYAQ